MEHPYAPSVGTLVELLRYRATVQGDRSAYTFLGQNPGAHETWTYAELDERARAVGAWLQARDGRGARVMLLFEEGLDYLAALFGCMYAGALACPCHPPDSNRLQRTLPRLQQIAKDASVRFVLSSSMIQEGAQPHLASIPSFEQATWLAVDTLDPHLAQGWTDPELQAEDLAYLQYTSGSTSTPKGVMISHHNLIHQLHDFDTGYAHDPDSVMVSWLPATHDLGLVYGRLMPLFIGFRCVFLSPGSFMRRPARWMQAMSEWRGTHSPSPNFGYEVAASKTSPEEVASLDLSCVRVLLNGAEPIRQASEQKFTTLFAAAGLPNTALTHAMGMSEATAKVMTEPIDRYPPKFLHVDAEAYERNEVRILSGPEPGCLTIASCGSTLLDTRCVIADPETFHGLPECHVGELWVHGTTVAQGYWNQPENTAATFHATLQDGDGPFLRTGDLAFIHEGEIYLAGRLKDVIILRGQNHHPHDLEWAALASHPALRPNCAAAFGQATPEGERLVLVAEVYPDRLEDPEDVFGAIRGALTDLGIAPLTLALLEPRALPKTSSGKLQRNLTRTLLAQDALPLLHRWDRPEARPSEAASPSWMPNLEEVAPHQRVRLLEDGMMRLAASLLGLDPEDMDPDRPFRELGLDSVTAVELVETVGQQLNQSLSATLLFDHPTIGALATFIADQYSAAGSPSNRTPETTQDVEQMSEEEAEAALLRELDEL
jgi:acyl-CoA synthetase (AMP-forming)/AMP-acid ligase II/acyl carrier protein